MNPLQAPPPVNALLQQALALHRQGRGQEALAHYRRVLDIDRSQFDAWCGLGVLSGQSGDLQRALYAFTAGCSVRPEDSSVHFKRALALHALGRYNEALHSYGRALSLQPDFALGQSRRGDVLNLLGRVDEAVPGYRRALALDPALVEAHNHLGTLLASGRRHREALTSFACALALKPDHADAHYNRGNALKELRRYHEALPSYARALALRPDFAGAYNNRGTALKELHLHEEALVAYDRALAMRPDSVAHYNRGNALRELGRHEESLACYARALAMQPDFADAYNNRAIALKELHRHEDALAAYDRVIAIRRNYAKAYLNKALLLLLLGEYEQGWRLHEWRHETDAARGNAPPPALPLWNGQQPLAEKTLLLTTEQGRGDLIQFVRYVPMVEALGARVVLRVPASVNGLISTLHSRAVLIDPHAPLPPCDAYCPLMSLPLAFKTRVDTIPAEVPYLQADPQRQERWRRTLGRRIRPRIGLAWSGNPQHINDRNRSMPLRLMAPLLELDYEYFALQTEVRAEDRATLRDFKQIRTHDLRDWVDTAAVITELDLVISVDTAPVHLAGALGRPVWILLPYDPDFRWLLERTDSPWYPTARLFRQPSLGDWQSVIASVCAALSTGAKPGSFSS